ncbi:hypothetical protein [Candidatus Nitrospira salsa]
MYTNVIPDTKAKTFMGVMPEQIIPDRIVDTETSHSLNVLAVSEFKPA